MYDHAIPKTIKAEGDTEPPDFWLYKSQLFDAVYTGSIIRIEALSNYSKLYFSNGKTMVIARLISHYEQRLAEHNFVRIHRSHLVNLKCIDKIITCNSKVVLLNGECLKISRRKMEVFRKLCSGFGSNKELFQS